ncbi:MAG: ATP-binding cassette domain-containing protein, partial [Candidatus Micrarchaeia archaeon]
KSFLQGRTQPATLLCGFSINEFMDGYLREENVRFRETSLRFELYSAAESGKQIFFSYPSMEKNYGRFMLHADAGNVRKGEVVGIVGPNAIGKSTFIKLMAGVEKPDNDAKIPEMTISYKPQYIKIDFDGKVDEYITIEKVGQEYIKEFELDGLLHKKVAHLSGGEIQRLAIACALSKDVDIYLLDEPSAFLDIEQRMRLSTIITRDIMNKEKVCFVVDHDIVFIDSIASRIIRFAGTSSVEGHANSPEDKVAAMNAFLKDIDITLRRDKDTLRPKINKKGSVLDREQRQAGNYYYYVS